MATRSIVTSHPDVECAVCGRRLLRGEQPDVFLSSGRRRTVCELCAPRASHEGWLREADTHPVSLEPARGRRSRTWLERLRQLRESPRRDEDASELADPAHTGERGSYDFLDGSQQASKRDRLAFLETPDELSDAGSTEATFEQQAHDHAGERMVTSRDMKLVRALEIFNASEQPRRVAGVARSLGAPLVNVRAAADSTSRVSIVVAWELCWYRYEVDLADEAAGVHLAQQGMEVEQLEDADRAENCSAGERGELVLQPSQL